MKDVNKEVEAFKKLCQAKAKDEAAQILHSLSEAGRIAEEGVAASHQYSSSHLFVPALGSTALGCGAAKFKQFLENVALLENIVDLQFPVLVLWDLNGIPASLLMKESSVQDLEPQITLMKELLNQHPAHTCGFILERRACPGGLTRRKFHSAIYGALESKGIDCDTDLVLNFKEVARPNTFPTPCLSVSNSAPQPLNKCYNQPFVWKWASPWQPLPQA